MHCHISISLFSILKHTKKLAKKYTLIKDAFFKTSLNIISSLASQVNLICFIDFYILARKCDFFCKGALVLEV